MEMQSDIIILGGGLTGLAMALLSANQGFSVTVVEARTPNLAMEGWESRTVAINRATENLLKEIKVWEKIDAKRIAAYDRMIVWDEKGFGEIVFHSEEVMEPNLGYIIENKILLKALWDTVSDTPLITVIQSEATAFSAEENFASLELQNQQCLKTKLIIGADGADSWLRKAANMECNPKDEGETALIALVETEAEHQQTAYQRFLSKGILAFLPMPEPHLSAIVFSAPKEANENRMILSEEQLRAELGLLFDYRLGEVKRLLKRATFPIRTFYVKQLCRPRLVLIGDAAHVIHPLAGQGVNLGFQDAVGLNACLVASRERGYDIGEYLRLRSYERERKGPTLLMLHSLAGLKALFESQVPGMALLRSTGLNTVNETSILKKAFIRQAMGLPLN